MGHYLRSTLLVAALAASLFSADASAQPRSALPRVALDGNGLTSFRLLDGAGPLAVPVAVRLAVPPDMTEAGLDALINRGTSVAPLWLAVPVPATSEALTAWRAGLRRIMDRAGDRLVILELTLDRQAEDVMRFAAQVAATELGTERADARLALGGPAMDDATRRDRVYTAALAPYVDLLALRGNRAPATIAWLGRVDPDARLVLTGREVAPDQDSAQALAASIAETVGSVIVAEAWLTSELTPDALRGLRAIAPLVAHDVTTVDADAVALAVRIGDAPAPESVRHRLLFDTESFSTLLVYWGGVPGELLTVSLRVPIAGTVVVTDLVSGDRLPGTAFSRDDATGRVTVTVPLTGRPMLVDFNEGAVASGQQSGVTAERPLTVDEIILRHRRQQLAQDRAVRTYIADARMRLFFRPTIADPGYDVVTENRYYVAEDGIEWERTSFAVNNRRFSSNEPFPMLQPEKVFALPLQLRFDEGYTYRLAGTARVDGYDCYEVRFEPVRQDPSLYRGTVWIDRRTFARIQVQAVQGGLPGMIISNDETQHYAPVAAVGNQPVFLLQRLIGRQIALIAGRNITLENQVEFSGFRVNDDGFIDARAAARAGERAMYRQTPDGLRPYVKRNNVRVVEAPTQSVKAMAIGLIVDPSYQFPLPIFGINYVDFAFGDAQTQLAMLFAGVLAAGNIQRPQLFGTKNFHGSVDFFAIAAPSSDRVYEESGERESERLLTWPLSTGLNLGWQATPFQKVSAQYQFRFDGYVRDTTTSETFDTPSSTVTNGIGVAWEYSRGGYTAALNAAWFARTGWEPWGEPGGTLQTTASTYAKYGASLSRDFLIDVFQKIHVNGSWFGGRDLDRFVRYQFGLFDATRIHGVPASVRFGELALVRGSYSLNLFEQFRLDLFAEHGWGRDARGEPWQNIPAIGGAFNLPGPWNTIVRADVGRSWLPDRYSTLGSTTLQIMLLKPLR